MNEKQRSKLASTKARLKSSGILSRGDYQSIFCTECHKNVKVRITSSQAYTPDVLKTWKCPYCRYGVSKPKGVTMAKATAAPAVKKSITTKPVAQAGLGKAMAKVPPAKVMAAAETFRKDVVKTIKKAGPEVSTKKTVDDIWYEILRAAVGKGNTDKTLAMLMTKASPTGKQYTEESVAAHRSGYNNGRLPIQKGVKPAVRLEKYESPSKETK